MALDCSRPAGYLYLYFGTLTAITLVNAIIADLFLYQRCSTGGDGERRTRCRLIVDAELICTIAYMDITPRRYRTRQSPVIGAVIIIVDVLTNVSTGSVTLPTHPVTSTSQVNQLHSTQPHPYRAVLLFRNGHSQMSHRHDLHQRNLSARVYVYRLGHRIVHTVASLCDVQHTELFWFTPASEG